MSDSFTLFPSRLSAERAYGNWRANANPILKKVELLYQGNVQREHFYER